MVTTKMKSEIKYGVLIIYPVGNLLAGQNTDSVIESIMNHFYSGSKKVLFNMSEVDFMNSNGLALLLLTLSKVRTRGGEIALCSISDQTKQLLQITKLTSIFMVFVQEADAISYLNR